MAREDLVALKRAIGSMRGRIDQLLTGGEKRQLLKMISVGKIGNVGELKAYLSRVEAVKAKRKKESSAKLTGKIIDANTRRALGDCTVRVQQTAFSEDTDGSGCFIWERMVKGRTIVIDVSKRGYKGVQFQYKATMDEEQTLAIKLAPVGGRRQQAQDKKKRGGGH